MSVSNSKIIEQDIKIIHHGGKDGVTGSCHQLFYDFTNSQKSILVDCGLFQGDESNDQGSINSDQLMIGFPVDNNVVALVVTHVHIDHVGRIPYLLAAGFNGPIYCSEPSAQLLPLVLEDALKIGFTKNKRLIDKFLRQIEKQIKPLTYKKWQKIDDQLKIKLKPAGHILGSSYVECHVSRNKFGDTKLNSKTRIKHHVPKYTRVTFSGDLGATYSPLLAAPKSPYRSDILILESTYGDKNHQGRKDRRKTLADVINRAVKNRGVILIPAFSIGRTQELLYELEELLHKNKIDDIEVIVDSPLAAKFTQTYRKLKKYWDKEAQRKLKRKRHPLAFEQLWTVNEHKEHLQTVKYLKKSAKPTIVIAASGMCSGGRIVNYLKALITDSRTDLLFVGYQAQGTPGRVIQKYAPRHGWVELGGKRYTINAIVKTISGYSAHADQKNLINFVKRMRYQPKEIHLIHGDKKAKTALGKQFKQLLPDCEITE